jgi:hypothetical protein
MYKNLEIIFFWPTFHHSGKCYACYVNIFPYNIVIYNMCVYTHIYGLNSLEVVQKHFERRGNEGRARILYLGIKNGEIIVKLRCRSD